MTLNASDVLGQLRNAIDTSQVTSHQVISVDRSTSD
jgi:hypothetical protein